MTRHGRRRRWLAAVLVLGLLLAGGVVWLRRDTARPVTIEEAERRLTTTTAGTGATTTTSVSADLRPEAGVYEYRGSGSEKLSLPPLSQDQGPTVPGTVEHLAPGCWRFRVDYSSNHWQTWNYCRRGGDLVESGGQTWSRWMIGATAITNLSTFTCDPGAMVLPSKRTVGQEWSARCSGANDTGSGDAVSAGPYRFLGEEDLDVGGTTVRTAHFLRRRTMSQAQKGTERSEVWFAVDTGLPVRNSRRLVVTTDTPVGTSTYTEVGEFRLVSTTPSR